MKNKGNEFMSEENIKKCIYNNFKYLLALDFIFDEKSVKYDFDLPDYQVYFFRNSDIYVRLFFIEMSDLKPVMNLSILKNNENKAFSFKDYLKMKSIKNYKSFPEESSKDYIARIAQLFKQESEGDLKDVLNGKKWIDVPIDYMGYK